MNDHSERRFSMNESDKEEQSVTPPEITKHRIRFTHYNALGVPSLWELEADLFGVWAIHQAVLADDTDEFPWLITPWPSGAHVLWARDYDVALEAGRRLGELRQPVMVVKEPPQFRPIPKTWRQEAA